ncbi:hypothetical protein [Psychrobacter aquaticus]|uniref:Uncharacterized protein n=1 Tax=Psychrobacter aquaticus CMS 56 TaxID=1354303 RepID=U4T6K1_9GAMM|nr:hypothetical protein [Psychrobacter aquaticus]ERL55786.1 hypothetical protein M917_1308 [Psychrobacter aquaticus CMS 56]
MAAKYCYTRFKLFKNEINVYKYRVIFIIGNRSVKTKTLTLNDNKSSDIRAKINKNESIKNCNAYVDMYLKNGTKINSKPLLLKVSDASLEEETQNLGISATTSLDNIYTLFSFSVTTGVTQSHPNVKETKLIYTMKNAPAIPAGLRWVAFLRNEIKKSARKNEVAIMAIASIIFQEKYHGIWATYKNNLSYVLKDLDRNSSYGYGEMQLGLAADLLGYSEQKNPKYLRKTFDLITTNAEVALDLVGKNINIEQTRRGRKLSTFEATVFHNSGVNGLNSI